MKTKELAGIAHELKFWQGFVKTERFLKGWVPDMPTPELNARVREIILSLLPPGGQVLDVGSGVVSILRGLIPQENLTAVDPLGGLYQLIFDYGRYQIAPPIAIPAEEIQFPDTFDIVHCSNALDHVQDPGKAIERMEKAIKKNGHLIIQGFENEGQYEHYHGFHQWNIIESDGRLMIRGDGSDYKTFVGEPELCQRFPLPGGKIWYIWVAKKRA